MDRCISWWKTIALILVMMCETAGCAEVHEQSVHAPAVLPWVDSTMTVFADGAGQVGSTASPSALDAAMDGSTGAAVAEATVDQKRKESEQGPESRKETRKKEIPDEDEAYDPFQTETERALVEDYDPWEPFNEVMFEFNRKFDQYLLKPVAKAYNFILPDAVQLGVANFFHNVRFVPRLMNNLFQAKFQGAGIEMSRFLINSTIGVGGFFDPAKNLFDLETPDEDAGQTLGVYGVGPGPYLVLPLQPPYTLRDFFGFIVDLALDPINWLVFPVIEIEGVPSAVAHKNRDTSTIAQFGTRAGAILNDRAINLDVFQGVEESTLDMYGAVRNGYLQRRAKQIRE